MICGLLHACLWRGLAQVLFCVQKGEIRLLLDISPVIYVESYADGTGLHPIYRKARFVHAKRSHRCETCHKF